MNPHNLMTRTAAPPIDAWRCDFCKKSGTFKGLRKTECTYVYPPCKYCGETPECARDCAGMLAALGSPGVEVIGATPELKREIRRAKN